MKTDLSAGRTARTLDAIPVFFTKKMVANIESFSPSSGKPSKVMQSWSRLGVPLRVQEPLPASIDQFYRAHDTDYVDGVLSLRIANGFGNHSRAVADTLPWTAGAMLAAAQEALSNRCVAVAPCSGFHHARYDVGGGYCTFNGLAVAATALLDKGTADRVGILDLDHHYGDGTDDIIRGLRLTNVVQHYSAGGKYWRPSHANTFLQRLPSIVEEFAQCDLLLYQAGVDPHVNDELGGWLTTQQLVERDRIVFATCKRIGLPVAWTLAGGYQTPLRRVLQLHDNTMVVCAETFLAVKQLEVQ